MSKDVGEVRVKDVTRVKVAPGELLVIETDADSILAEAVIHHLKERGISPVLIVQPGTALKIISIERGRGGAQTVNVRVVP